ncbi:hypothetical protein D3C75_997830 [compost metagenome]
MGNNVHLVTAGFGKYLHNLPAEVFTIALNSAGSLLIAIVDLSPVADQLLGNAAPVVEVFQVLE